ncbi:MAG: putative N-acetyltransferase YjaB [Candidatus Hydrogenedentota bacterium]
MIRDVYMPNAETCVYEQDGKVVGFLSLLDNEVGAVFVQPAHHGQGIGRSLLDHAQTIRPTLFLEVFRENQRSVNFYLNYGFTAVSERPHESLGNVLIRMEL